MYGEERAPESQWEAADAIRRRLPPMDMEPDGTKPNSKKDSAAGLHDRPLHGALESLLIDRPATDQQPGDPITLTAAIGSHMLNQTSAAASATKPIRSASGHRKAWPCSGVVQKRTTAVRKKIRRSRSSVLSKRFRAGANQASSRSRTSWIRCPGNVLAAWRSLVRRGVLDEGLGKQRGIFSVKG